MNPWECRLLLLWGHGWQWTICLAVRSSSDGANRWRNQHYL